MVGMASTVENGLELISTSGNLDAAVIEINLGGMPVFPVAERLQQDGVPFVFTTGYDGAAIPSQFKDVVRCEKPFNVGTLLRLIKQVIRT